MKRISSFLLLVGMLSACTSDNSIENTLADDYSLAPNAKVNFYDDVMYFFVWR